MRESAVVKRHSTGLPRLRCSVQARTSRCSVSMSGIRAMSVRCQSANVVHQQVSHAVASVIGIVAGCLARLLGRIPCAGRMSRAHARAACLTMQAEHVIWAASYGRVYTSMTFSSLFS